MIEQLSDILRPVIEGLMGQHGTLLAVVLWIGSFRVIFKPTMTYLQAVTEATATTKDNELLAKIMASKPYKVLSFLLDYTTSLKLPQAS